jgi:glycerol-3-phosphate acyltransferase PlsX
MGGDAAPRMVVSGASIARRRHPEVHYLMFGRTDEIAPLLDKLPPLKAVTTLVHADDVVDPEAKPSTALRGGRASSMRLAIDSVRDGRAAGVVSAGNTGALMAMSKVVLKTLPGVNRPAMAAFFPTLRGESLMLDLGANLVCDARHLVDFAVMGNAFARTVLGIAQPTYGILNVGSEEQKGHEYLQEASAVLREAKLPGEFAGFVEGDDIAKGTVDVVITDGFTGNVALKAAEGTAMLVNEYMRRTFRSSLVAGIGYLLARRALGKLRERLDPRRYNGAIFLGLNGVAVKSHGGSDALAFANAIGVAVDMARYGIIEKTRADFAALIQRPGGSAEAAAGQ